MLQGSATCVLSWLSVFVSILFIEEVSYIALLKMSGNIEGSSYAVVISRKRKANLAVSGLCQ